MEDQNPETENITKEEKTISNNQKNTSFKGINSNLLLYKQKRE